MTTAERTRTASSFRRKTLHELRTAIKHKGPSDFAFECISSGPIFQRQIQERLQNPYHIRQGNTPLCGPAAFIYCIAKHFPEQYERYALELALYGKGRIGDLVIEPSNDCLNAKDGLLFDNDGFNFSPVDWVTLASVRDSTNLFASMDGPGSNIAGMTFPGALEAWFEETGLFAQVEEHTSTIVSSSYANLLRANEKFKAGHCVCLLIQGSIIGNLGGIELGVNKFQKETPKTAAAIPNHWVVQTTQMMIDQKRAPHPGTRPIEESINSSLDFDLHSWGINGKSYPVNNRINEMTPDKFTRYYHGFVSARPREE